MLLSCPWSQAQDLPEVASADLIRMQPSDFSDNELDIPYYLAHFHRVVNSIVSSGPDRGFVSLSVWRDEKHNRPFNIRIMEHILTMSFFYTQDRPWNPYRGDPAVRARLEAAMDFWCRKQNEDGRFSEYRPNEWNLAGTAFAVQFMSQSLTYLHDGPPIDPVLIDRVKAGVRKAIHALLTIPALYAHGRYRTNQYNNLWSGGWTFLQLYPDRELETTLRSRYTETATDMQSPAGYFYETDGADWGYNLNTNFSILLLFWRTIRGADVEKTLLNQVRHYFEWLSYNAVREPDGAGYTLNSAIETRTHMAYTPLRSNPFAEVVEAARAFSKTRDTAAQELISRRTQLQETWPEVRPLRIGESSYSPHTFELDRNDEWYPTPQQQAAEVSRLPYLTRERFTHQRVDNRKPNSFTYIRRPGYYSIFNAGEILWYWQRYGLGLLWSPSAGTLIQSQSEIKEAAWGTVPADSVNVYESKSFQPEVTIDNRPVTLQAGVRDLPDGLLTIRYPLQKRGAKTLEYAEDHITVRIQHPGQFTEQIPFLKMPGDILKCDGSTCTLKRNGVTLSVTAGLTARATLQETSAVSGNRPVVVLRLESRDSLEYQLALR